MVNSTSTVVVHNTSTEFLIVISQTVFFVLLFLMLKSGLVDRRGMMYNKRRIQEEMFQLGAIFFAIFVIIGILMIPLESYEYAHFVIPLTFIILVVIVVLEVYMVFSRDDGDSVLPTVKPPVGEVGEVGASVLPANPGIATTFWPRGGGFVGSTRRPFNF